LARRCDAEATDDDTMRRQARMTCGSAHATSPLTLSDAPTAIAVSVPEGPRPEAGTRRPGPAHRDQRMGTATPIRV
jgi:hypothetical protein